MAQTLEKIVRCPVLLDDHDDMLETRDLRVSEQRSKEKQERTSNNEFHPVLAPEISLKKDSRRCSRPVVGNSGTE